LQNELEEEEDLVAFEKKIIQYMEIREYDFVKSYLIDCIEDIKDEDNLAVMEDLKAAEYMVDNQ